MSLTITTKNGIEIDTKEAAVSMVINSPLFAESMPGSFSYPFTLPTSPVNQNEFGFLENGNAKDNRTISHEVIVANSGLNMLHGRLKVREAYQQFYDCDITVPYGNVSTEFWETPMNQLNWGGETLPTVTRSPNVFVGDVPEADIGYFGLRSLPGSTSFYEISINNSVIFSHENSVGIQPEDNLQTRLAEMIGVFNLQFIGQYQLAVQENSVQLLGDQNTNLAMLQATISNSNATPRNLYVTLDKIPTYQEPSNDYFLQLSETNFYEKPWRMVTMLTADNVANLFFNFSTFIDVSQFAANRQQVCPVPTLKMILEGLASQIDYRIEGDFYEDADLQELCFYSGYVLDKQLEGITFPFLILDADFQYAKMMPTWSFKKFINELRNTFNLSVTFNNFTRKIIIRKADIVVQSVPAVDLSDITNPNYRTFASEQQKNNMQLAWKDDPDDPYIATIRKADAENDQLTTPFLASYPNRPSEGFDALQSELQPIPEKVTVSQPSFSLDVFSGGQLPWYSYPTTGDPFAVTEYRNLICHKPLYNNIKDIDTAPRMFFYNEKLTGSPARGFYRLHWSTPIVQSEPDGLATGIFPVFWAKTKKFFQDVFEIETEIALHAAELANFDPNQKILLFGGDYLIKQIDVNFPIKNASKIRLWRC